MSDVKKPSQTGTNEYGFDAEFDAFLREEDSRLAALYRKLPHPEPDAALDARVRARARRALNESARTIPARAQRARRWLPALSAAATLVFAAGLAWRLMPPASPTHEAAPIADSTAPAVVPGEGTAPVPAPAAPSPERPSTAQAPADTAAQYKHKLHREIAAKPVSSAAAEQTKTDVRSAANGALAAAPKAAAPAAAAPLGNTESAAFPSPAAEQRAKSVPPPVAAAAPPPSPPAAMEAETARPASAAAAAPPAALREAASADRAAAAQAFADGGAAAGSSFVVTPDPSAPARYRWEIAGGARAGTYPPDPPPLAAWVEIVRAMLRDGHGDAARRALADLRAHHADFRVPPDLRGLE